MKVFSCISHYFHLSGTIASGYEAQPYSCGWRSPPEWITHPSGLLTRGHLSVPVPGSLLVTQVAMDGQEAFHFLPFFNRGRVDLQYYISFRCTTYWVKIFTDYIPFIVIKYWLFSLCCTVKAFIFSWSRSEWGANWSTFPACVLRAVFSASSDIKSRVCSSSQLVWVVLLGSRTEWRLCGRIV